MNATNYDLTKTIRDLLVIAKVAMPAHLYEIDPRVHAGRKLLDALSASQHRPPSVTPEPTVPMATLTVADPADPWAKHAVEALDAFPKPDIEIALGIDRYLAEPNGPATRPAAIEHILRDWLTGHGYIEHREAGDPYH